MSVSILPSTERSEMMKVLGVGTISTGHESKEVCFSGVGGSDEDLFLFFFFFLGFEAPADGSSGKDWDLGWLIREADCDAGSSEGGGLGRVIGFGGVGPAGLVVITGVRFLGGLGGGGGTSTPFWDLGELGGVVLVRGLLGR